MRPTLFLSYAWANSNIASKIDTFFQQLGINVKRDIREITYKGNIKEYMQQIRQTDFALIIISENFLKSMNCMYEVLELFKEQNFDSKILPVIVDGTQLYKPHDQLKYINYWSNEFDELSNSLKAVSLTDSIGIIKSLKEIETIKGSISNFLEYLSTNKTSTFSELIASNFRPVLEHMGLSEDALFKRILAINKLQTHEEKEIEIDKLEEEYPNNAKVYFLKGYFAFSQEKFSKSSYFYQKAIDRDASFAPSYYNLAYNKEVFENKFEEAKRLYEKTIELDSANIRAYVNLGRLYSVELNNIFEAKKYYEKALEIDPYDEETLFNYGIILSQKFERHEDAAMYLRTLTEYFPNSTNLNAYGRLLWAQLRQYDNAKEAFIEALQYDNGRKETLNNIAELYEKGYKDVNQAKKYYESCILIEPNRALDHFKYAVFLMLHFLPTEREIANKHYEIAYSLDSSYKNDKLESILLTGKII